ncbi:helix-turn-helix domain-containing protein [Comamonas sp.]|uniref:helix-turn-helix domain-containing protein n=1 Tax=Comamonas sp. TaxID=34028 RepID=UPI0039171DB2
MAQAHGFDQATVRRWVKSYQQHGLSGLMRPLPQRCNRRLWRWSMMRGRARLFTIQAGQTGSRRSR